AATSAALRIVLPTPVSVALTNSPRTRERCASCSAWESALALEVEGHTGGRLERGCGRFVDHRGPDGDLTRGVVGRALPLGLGDGRQLQCGSADLGRYQPQGP